MSGRALKMVAMARGDVHKVRRSRSNWKKRHLRKRKRLPAQERPKIPNNDSTAMSEARNPVSTKVTSATKTVRRRNFNLFDDIQYTPELLSRQRRQQRHEYVTPSPHEPDRRRPDEVAPVISKKSIMLTPTSTIAPSSFKSGQQRASPSDQSPLIKTKKIRLVTTRPSPLTPLTPNGSDVENLDQHPVDNDVTRRKRRRRCARFVSRDQEAVRRDLDQ